MSEIVYTREIGWMPYVVRRDGVLFLEFGAGSDANHEPRTFNIPITKDHLEVIRTDFIRHILLWSAVLPLAEAAGTRDPLDEHAAVALLDPILLGSEAEIEKLFKEIKWHHGHLIAHHADPALLALGKIFAAAQSLTKESDPQLVREYDAGRRHLFIPSLDEAVLRYTNKYLYGGGLPSRNPDAVDPELLPQVLAIIGTAEQACANMEFPLDYGTDYGRYHKRDKKEWNKLKDTVEQAVLGVHPTIQPGSAEAVSFLMCSEAASRARAAQRKYKTP